MNIDNRVPCATTLALVREIGAAIQPGLRLVEAELAAVGAAAAAETRARLQPVAEQLAAIGAELAALLLAHSQAAAMHHGEGGAASHPPAGKEGILYAPHARRHRRQYLKILLVEDSPVSNAITKAMLEQQGWRVSGALSGREALEKLTVKSAYDLIITDLNMEGMDGLELAREIRRLEGGDSSPLAHVREGRPPLPIIALTGGENSAALAACRAAGIDDMVIKSTSFDLLIAAIEKQLDRPSPG